MTTTTSQLTHAPPRSTPARPTVPPRMDWNSPSNPTVRQRVGEMEPIISAPAFFGPPIILVLGPWLLLVLLLVGAFTLILTVLVLAALAACLLAVLVAALASPYLLVRHLNAHDPAGAKRHAALHLFPHNRVGAGPVGPPRPKGMS